ncbi:Permease [Candidatus Nitrotoga sp. BS]|uniref:AI-2E family transporter n=1 Tax=Candidatus Nitrotoga sp. BS TaxID=2890408 RepID=UPI001EF1C830|nr:AI-2E family transporter [Candidatus Nitrotoga sp. BS]CAH1201931.1 Permease [Candidatus Nitrotoga sp. BS]
MDSNTSDKKIVGAPINIRSTALATLTIMALIVFLEWAQSFFAPIVVGMLLSYALYPIVSFLKRRLWLPHWVGALLVVSALVGASWFAVGSLQEQAVSLLDKLPNAVKKFTRENDVARDKSPSVLEKLQSAAVQVEKAAGADAAKADKVTSNDVVKVQIQDDPFDFREYLLGGSMNAVVFMSQYISVLLLVFFILASGRLYKEKLVKISGNTLSKKKLTVEILEDINRQLRLFFFVMLFGAVFVGVGTWLAFIWLGVEQAALWGVLAGIASMVPYLGPGVIFFATGLVAFLQFATLGMALIVAAVSLAITSFQGNILTPLMTSRTLAMNAAVVFISLLFWGWLWGPIGLVVATPAMLVVKCVCDHVKNLQSFGELLGG